MTDAKPEWADWIVESIDAGEVVGFRCRDCGTTYTWHVTGPKPPSEVTRQDFLSQGHGEDCEYGEDRPHRPPKYVEGHYKPHFGDAEADFAVLVHPVDFDEEPQLGTTDASGDAAGVVRELNGRPIYEGGTTLVGHVYDGEIRLRDFWQDRIDEAAVRSAVEVVDIDPDSLGAAASRLPDGCSYRVEDGTLTATVEGERFEFDVSQPLGAVGLGFDEEADP